MELTISQEPMDNRQLALTIEVDQQYVNQELQKAARKLGRQYRIPGFRKGKAPYNIIVRYLGMPTLYQEFVDDLGQEVYKKAIEQEEIEPYAMGALEDITFDPLQYKVTIPMDPEIDLGDYRSIRIAEEDVEVSDEDVQAELERYQEQYADWQEIDAASAYGDLMTLDVRSVLVDEGDNPILDDEGTETVIFAEPEWDVTPDEENPMDPPGLDEEVVGLSVGDKKAFTLQYPEDAQSVNAGKRAKFTIEVKKVQRHTPAELNDELAQMIGPEFETVDALKENIRENMLEQATAQAENEYLDEALRALVEQSTLNYPPVVVEDQLNSMLNDFAVQLRRFGIEDIEDYFRNTGQSIDDFRESQREEATRMAERNLVISELLTAEKLKVNDGEIQEQIDEMVGDSEDESAQTIRNMFANEQGRAIIESQILQQKTLDRLVAIAKGEEIPEPTDDDDDEVDAAADDADVEAATVDSAEEADAAGGDAESADDTPADASND